MNNKLKFETIAFTFILLVFQCWLITINAIWIDYTQEQDEALNDVNLYATFFTQKNLMVFFGFAFLMSFMHQYAYSSIAYAFLITAIVCEWSIPLGLFFKELDKYEHEIRNAFSSKIYLSINDLIEALSAGASVMISFGVIIGRVSPLQMLIIAILQPIFYWLNIFIIQMKLEALNLGGFSVNIFGAYFGMAMARFFANRKSVERAAHQSAYINNIFSLIGTLFLWLLWPSANASASAPGIGQVI
eukprot:TRINITY_DN546_c2_g2_i2.p1 TRINITY_DN546_c2_g2~~TRINITY_DN546_c2_g2_i2.p1  ORF type:complete len:245 (+),score=76.97 TRINITY_DN546_c2_g2_i2:98-832(+)